MNRTIRTAITALALLTFAPVAQAASKPGANQAAALTSAINKKFSQKLQWEKRTVPGNQLKLYTPTQVKKGLIWADNGSVGGSLPKAHLSLPPLTSGGRFTPTCIGPFCYTAQVKGGQVTNLVIEKEGVVHALPAVR